LGFNTKRTDLGNLSTLAIKALLDGTGKLGLYTGFVSSILSISLEKTRYGMGSE